jgi:aminotransferase
MHKSNLSLSRRSGFVIQSEIRAMSIECDKIGGINLSQGICDVPVPTPVRTGAKNAIDDGINQYTRYDGIDELRQVIAKKVKDYNKIDADADKNIVVSGGSTGSFFCSCMSLLDRGDEVILFEPYYGYHLQTLLATDNVPLYAKLSPPDWTFDIDELERLITPKTRGIMINTPANPCGKVFTREELNTLAEFCIKHDLFVFTDEIYEYFLYDGNKHISPGSLEQIADRTITISGYSKTFSITGWRVGYSVSDEKWTQRIGFMNDLIYVCSPAPLQMGVAKGIKDLPNSYYENLCDDYLKKRNQTCDTLEEVGLHPYIPQGAYYVLADNSILKGTTSKEKAMYLLQKTGVATVPGEAFYNDDSGERLIRFCFAKSDNDIDRACESLKKLKYTTW